MRVVVAGGGTGGHIYPALAIAKALGGEILYIGGQKGIEKEILPATGLEYRLIDVEGFSRKLTLKNVVTAYKAFRATNQMKKILKDYQPDVVIATGGYVSGPVGQAAASLKKPLFLQEQNSYPGVTIRLLAKKAEKIFLGSKGAERYLPKEKCLFTGNPVREEIIKANRENAQKELALFDKTLLLITGGSQGAKAINNAIRPLYKAFAQREDLVVVHHCGKNDFPNVSAVAKTNYPKIASVLGDEAISIEKNIFITPYIQNMALILAASDLVVCRAGAIFLSEAAVLGIPLILVPYPYAAENHQTHNARIWQETGAGRLVLESNMEEIEDVLCQLLDDKEKRQAMGKKAKTLGNPQATLNIVQEIKASLLS